MTTAFVEKQIGQPTNHRVGNRLIEVCAFTTCAGVRWRSREIKCADGVGEWRGNAKTKAELI